MAMIGLALLGMAAWIASQQLFVVHGRFISGYVSVTEGVDAYWQAASLACMGLALFGPLYRRLALATVWLLFWLTLAVILPVAHAYLH